MSISRLILDTFNYWTVPTSTIIVANTMKPMTAMLLQAGLFTGMGGEYSGVVSTMEFEWEEEKTDLRQHT